MRRRWRTSAGCGPWQEQWGATDEEAALALPGDELLAEPATQLTRAITIDAPRSEVWPWLVQLGADRGGFYTYDRRALMAPVGLVSFVMTRGMLLGLKRRVEGANPRPTAAAAA